MDGEEATAPEDVSKWTVDDVCSFVGGLSGCGEYAPVRGHLPRMVLSAPHSPAVLPTRLLKDWGREVLVKAPPPLPSVHLPPAWAHVQQRRVFFLPTSSPSCTTSFSGLCFLWRAEATLGHSPSTQALIPRPLALPRFSENRGLTGRPCPC